MNFEQVIFANLIHNEEYGKKTIAFLKTEYFHDSVEANVFNVIHDFVVKYRKFPSKESVLIDLKNKSGISEETFKKSQQLIHELQVDIATDIDWLVNETEKFCQEKAVYNGIMEAIKILDDKTGSLSRGSIPKILSDSLAVSFDSSIGHDYLADYKERFQQYHTKEVLLPFDLDYFNRITGGGLARKTLNIILAGTNVGKSLFMCHCAAANLAMGKNVLYITMEMAEEKIAKRIDANLLDIPLDELNIIPWQAYHAKVEKLKSKTCGKLIIKEYPTACAGSANFRHLLNELRLKKQFVPDIIYVDYLNICVSSRLKMGANVNSYTYIKTIAEELRGLAVEFNVPIVSATQTTRSGHANSDPELGDTSESFGLPATADFMFALTTSEELEKLNQIMVKQLKARDHDKKIIKRFVIGVDYTKMRLYDVEQTAQKDISDGPVMDKTKFGTPVKTFNKDLFSGFK